MGEEINEDSVAGGGRAIGGNADVEARKKLRVSHALRAFLAKQGEIGEADVGDSDDDPVSRCVYKTPTNSNHLIIIE